MIEVNGNIARGRVPLAAPLAASRAHIGGRPLFSAGVSRLRDSSQVQTMPANDFLGDDDDETTNNSSDPSTTYIEVNDRDHSDAYQVLSGGKDKRSDGNDMSLRQAAGSDIHDNFAELSVLLADAVFDSQKAAFMGYVQPDAGDIVDLIVSDETDASFKDVQQEVRNRYTDNGDSDDDTETETDE